MRHLVGRTAILTGASHGIGPYIARALAAERMSIVVSARSVDELNTLATELRALGVKAIAVPCDVSKEADRANLVAATTADFGGVDVLVNNAGIESTHSFHSQPPEEIARILDVNLTAPMLLARAVLPGMVERRRGHIVNIASMAAKVPTPYEVPYAASKAGLVHFTESLRSEYRGRGVSASSICPGFVSKAGMYADMHTRAGVTAPRLVGTSSPEKVAMAVVKCIRRDRPEAIVNPGPMRIFTTFAEAAPGTFERLFPLFGANALFKKTAEVAERE